MSDKDLHSGFIRMHILYHAAHGEIFGLGIIEELARHALLEIKSTTYS
jgi:PadR family transcriptional regulator PadR